MSHNEEAKPIRQFPNYKIDRQGNVYNSKGYRLKPETTNKGYLRVSLSDDERSHQRFSVHRLVAETYIPNPDNLPQVNHINENKTDNSVDNLKWCTQLDNLKHSGVIDKASVAKFTRVRCVDTGETYDSVKEATDRFGLSHSNIVACCSGRRAKCGGMRWEYAEKEN